jgi:hypothetical protein
MIPSFRICLIQQHFGLGIVDADSFQLASRSLFNRLGQLATG